MSMPPPDWQAPSTPPTKKKPPVLLIVGIVAIPCLCCPIFSAVVFPLFTQARFAARHTENVSRMKHLTEDVLLFSRDHQGQLPPMGSYDQFETAIQPYLAPTTPAKEQLRDVQGQPFYLNSRLSGKNVKAFKSTQTTPVLREPPLKRRTRIAIAYLDGHVENYGSSAEASRVWQQAIATP